MSLIGPKQKSPDVRLMSEMRTKPDCYSACNFDPLSLGIGVQN